MNRGFPSFAWWVALSGLLLVGCTHSSLRVGRSRSATLPPSLAADFAYARTSTRPCQVEVLESRPQFTIKRIQLPAVAEGSETKRWIDLDYYDLTSKAKTPVIMVLPMLGGGYALERHFASYFASRGYAAVIVRRDGRTMSAQVEELNRLFRDMVIDHKRVIDWMETQDDLDCSRIGVFGVSMGGIKGALLVPLENRIQAAALGLAGGDLPYILTHTTEPGLVKRREQELRTRNITMTQSDQRLRDLIT